MLSAFLKVSQRLTRLYNVTQINILHNLNFYNYRCWGKQGCFNTSHLPAQPSYMDVNGSGQGTGCSFLQSLFFTGRKNGQWFLKYTHAMFVGSNIQGTFNFEPFFLHNTAKQRHIPVQSFTDRYQPYTSMNLLRLKAVTHCAAVFRLNLDYDVNSRGTYW